MFTDAGWLERWRIYWSLEPSLRWLLRQVRHGYRQRPVGWIVVRADDLRVRREPLLVPKRPADLDRIYEADAWRAENPIERFFPLIAGKQDRRFRHTPHYHLLDHYRRTGEKLYEHDYTRLLVARARLQGRRRSTEYLRERVDALCRTFDSIRSVGYLNGRYRGFPIAVFERPIHPPTRDYEPTNYEVFEGHHRASAVSLIEQERIKVLVLRPIKVAEYDFTEDLPWDESKWPEIAMEGAR